MTKAMPVAVRVLGVVGLFLLLYLPTFTDLASIYADRRDFSHGFLVPVISAYLVWLSRGRLRGTATPGWERFGYAVMALAVMLLLTGRYGGISLLNQLSIIVMIWGMALSVGGREVVTALILPLTYLLLMLPSITDAAIARFHWPMQLMSSVVAGWLLRILGVPVLRHINYLELPGETLEVARVCSGVNFLVAIVAIGIPLAYLTQRTLAKRVVLLIASLLIGVLVNPLRIAMIGLWTHYGGGAVGDALHGPFHIFYGFSVSVVGIAALLAFSWKFSRVLDGRGAPETGLRLPGPGEGHPSTARVASLNVVLALLAATALLLWVRDVRPVRYAGALTEGLPSAIDGWVEKSWRSPSTEFADPAADLRHHSTWIRGESEVELYVAFYEYQTQGKEFVGHRYADLYANSSLTALPTASAKAAAVRHVVRNVRGGTQVVLYWYEIRGDIYANNVQAKLRTAFEGVARRDTSGTLAIVSTVVPPGKDERAATEAAHDFAGALLPLLHRSPAPSGDAG